MRTTRSTQLWLLGVLTAVAAVVTAGASTATPAHSGTVVTGSYIPHQGLGPTPTCDTVPTCAAWRASGCAAALASRGPAVGASIVPVRDLADGRTPRHFTFSMGEPASWKWGRVTLQLWRSDCTEVSGSQLDLGGFSGTHPLGTCSLGKAARQCGAATLVIPRTTAWMTVTPTADNVNLDWTLA